MSHAKLSPSSAAQWCGCPGSIRLTAGDEDTTSIYAEEGTAAHELLEKSLGTAIFAAMDPSAQPKRPEEYRGKSFNPCELQPEGFVADDDMIDAVTVAYDHVLQACRDYPDAVLHLERKVDPGFLINRKDCTGTADITIATRTNLTVLDYKHGRGVVVEAPGNLQTLLYGIGAYAALPPERRQAIETITTGIIQPRAPHYQGPVRTHTYTIGEIFQWIAYFAEAAANTDREDAPLIPGDAQCRWCSGKPRCPALQQHATQTLTAATVAEIPAKVLRSPEELTPQQQAFIVENAPLINAFIAAVEGYVFDQVKAGSQDYPGFKLVEGRKGNKKWVDDGDKTIRYVCTSFGLKKDDVTQPAKLLGPAKIQALAKKSEKATDRKLKHLEGLIEVPAGKLTLAPVSDPRPARLSNLEEVFKDVPQIGQEK